MSARTERSADPEVSKLQQHLQLLKKEYAKLQGHCADLEKKVALLSAHDSSADTFASRLIASVAALYKQNKYRCVNRRLVLKHLEMITPCSERVQISVCFDFRFSYLPRRMQRNVIS